jgi:hypothetical protein
MENTRLKIVMEEEEDKEHCEKTLIKRMKEFSCGDLLLTRGKPYNNYDDDFNIKKFTNSNDKLCVRDIYKALDEIEKQTGIKPKIDKPFISKFIDNENNTIETIKEYIKKNI